MSIPRLCLIAALAAATAVPARAQLVPPAPSKTPATPEYQPAKPVVPPVPSSVRQPPPPQTPAEPEKPLPSLIQKDAAGKIKPLTRPLDEAAVALLELDDPARARVEKSEAARRDEIDRLVIEKIGVLMEVRATMANLPASPDMDMMRTTTLKARAFNNNNKLLDRLIKDGAINPAEKTRAAAIAREYADARKQEIVGEVGHDVMKMVTPAFVMTIDESLAEANLSLDRMLSGAAPRQEQLLAKVDMPAEMRTQANKRLGDLKKAPPPGKTGAEHRVAVLRSIFFDTLKPDQQRAFLTAAYPRLFEEKPAEKKAEEPAAPAPKK